MSDVTDELSKYDPTTQDGLTNLVTAPVSVPYNTLTGGNLSDDGSQMVDELTGKAAQDAMDEAAAEAARAQQDIAGVYQRQLDAFREMTAPYQEVGESFLPELQDLLTEGGRAGFMQRALDSNEFQNIAGAATDQLISNSAALGNRLSSGIQEEVLGTTGQLASQYASNAYSDRLNQVGQGVNIGLNTLGGSLSALQSSASGQAGALGNIANINLQNANAQAMMGNPLMGLVGAGVGGLVGGPAGAGIGYQVGSSV